jgi:predicted nucleic acid-binding protein
MQVLVDTPIWSIAFRLAGMNLIAREERLTAELRELIRDGRAQLVGPVRQELLSGISEEFSFKKLRDHLRAFEPPPLEIADYEEAAYFHTQCRSRGIHGSTIDFLICAIAHRRDWEIFTNSPAFTRYARVVPLSLYQAR